MTGAELIAQERQRQIEREGWTPEHDDTHETYELLEAAVCYEQALGSEVPACWPFEPAAWKPSADRTRNLVKAGALYLAERDRSTRRFGADNEHTVTCDNLARVCAAEIDRLQRVEAEREKGARDAS